MRYWRHYPKFLQTILLMLLIFTLTSFSLIVGSIGLTKIFGTTVEAISALNSNSSPKIIVSAQFFQAINSLFTFLISALLFAYLCHPQPFNYLGFKRINGTKLLIWTVLLILVAVPVFAQIGSWIQQLDLGKGVKAHFIEQQSKMEALMKGSTIGDLLLYLGLFAVLPAFGEELLFRGIVMRFAYNNTQSIHFAILFSAGIFALAHGNAYHFLPIMLAGVLLGYIYYYSGTIWLSILAHFLNNALGVVLVFLGNRNVIPTEVSKADSAPWYVFISALAILGFAFFMLRKNSTPLASDWNDDFKGERQTN
ncbi:MAG: type II CAAX endopeptidase family protein [Bacteroidota bacterium]